ncbi:LON peptidase substrate-binding domain-containing protein [Limobrevibacterium gyesilva]|uniref:LON peptidase substrate-binding domain-containing protein n=1 Tax=Limobrevibacterium gyesilva TaxID=2991712 RepID=A0AA42CG78_9PROT|nr:LON peptidase substrate-binding domain-containing protein [Limobrevibacterium gyesilva]MCW3473555.1 LON peptidase substrate-binding domain-containing protein [Limobrevibacterium gyesilva]
MSRFDPRLEDLPEAFPVFPLTGALLLPRGKLPLNIFEPRYLALIEDALAAGRMFGMIQPDARRPAGPTGAGLYRIGCLGRLSSFSETEDGRYLVTLTGLIRFGVTNELEMRRGYRRVRGDFSAFTADLGARDETPVFDRAALLQALRDYFAHRGFEANWDAINQMPDDDLVITLCMVCPFEPPEKQALLEAPTPADRAQALVALLEIDTHQGPRDVAGDAPTRHRAS